MCLLTIASCGGGSADTADDRAQTVDVPPAGAAPEREQGSGDGEALTEAQLTSALLTVQDLPTGYTVGKSSNDEDSETTGPSQECSARYDALGEADKKDVSSEAEAGFEGPSLGTVLEQELESYEEEDVPVQRFKDVLSVLNDCPTFSDTDKAGKKTDFTISALSFPKKGDETVALNVKAKTADFDVVLNFIVVRIGRTVMSVAQGGLTADVAALEQAVDKGLERLTAAALASPRRRKPQAAW